MKGEKKFRIFFKDNIVAFKAEVGERDGKKTEKERGEGEKEEMEENQLLIPRE